MNTKHEHDDLQNELDALAQANRDEPDVGFERRVLESSLTPPAPHRHRRKGSTAWIPFATAAAVGAFAYFWWPTPPAPPAEKRTQVMVADSDESVTADIWLASLDTMDQLVASDELFSDGIEGIESQLDSTLTTFTTDIEWTDLGDSL